MKRSKREEYATESCPFCGHEHRVIIDQRGKASAQAAAKVGLSFHTAACPHNSDYKKGEVAKFVDGVLGDGTKSDSN